MFLQKSFKSLYISFSCTFSILKESEIILQFEKSILESFLWTEVGLVRVYVQQRKCCFSVLISFNILLRYVSIFLYTNSRFLNRGKKRFFKHFGRWSKFFQKFCKARHYFHFKFPVKIFGATLTSMFYNLWISILLLRMHLNRVGF